MVARIPLSRGMFALVDDRDAERISALRWTAQRSDKSESNFYATAFRNRATVYMHRVVIDAPRGLLVDHINGNGLDNRRSNLRLADRSQNNVNRGGYTPSSGFRGVYPQKDRFVARIYRQSVPYHLGMYSDPREAAAAYDRAALDFYGDFARLNFPQTRDA